MKSFGWFITGLLAAAVGAGIWAALAYFVHFELGWVAWGIGVLVGVTVAATAQERAGLMTGVGAAAIALAGIIGGKYIAIRVEVADIASESGWAEVTDELVISYIADEIAKARLDAGETIEWPTEFELGEASEEADYPTDIWAEASGRWESADDAWRTQYREFVEYTHKQSLAQFSSAVSEQALLDSFTIIDLVFFLLAVVSAWKIGSGSGGE